MKKEKLRRCSLPSSSYIKLKDMYSRRPLLTSGRFMYDDYESKKTMKPFCIPEIVLKSTLLPKSLPLYYMENGHSGDVLIIGNVTNIEYDFLLKSLVGDVHILDRYNDFVTKQIKEGTNGLSVEFNSREQTYETFSKIMGLELMCVCLVDNPANHLSLL